MSNHLIQSTAASEFPYLARVKDHLRIDHTDEDQYIQQLIIAAVQLIEQETGKDWRDKTWVEYWDAFPDDDIKIKLTKQQVTAVSSVKYYDADGTLQTWAAANYHTVLPTNTQAYLVNDYGVSYPATDDYRPDAVAITYTTSTTNELFEHAVNLLVAHWYEHRNAETELNLKPMAIGLDRIIDALAVTRW